MSKCALSIKLFCHELSIVTRPAYSRDRYCGLRADELAGHRSRPSEGVAVSSDNFDTKTIDLAAGPINLLADPDILAELDRLCDRTRNVNFPSKCLDQGKNLLCRARRRASPQSTWGTCLLVGDGFVIRLREGAPAGAWVWASSTGTAAISLALEQGAIIMAIIEHVRSGQKTAMPDHTAPISAGELAAADRCRCGRAPGICSRRPGRIGTSATRRLRRTALHP